MPLNYQQYQDEIKADIAAVLGEAECQPILFIGSGFSKRYATAPNWEELLRLLAEKCPQIHKDFAYYKQTYNGDLVKIGSIFTDIYREWAWGEGKKIFPEEFFSDKYPQDVFIKYMIAELLKGLGPSAKGSYGSAELDAEIAALKAIHPHSIISTNYDQLIEPLFPDYEQIIGQKILRKPYLSIGEIFKIHGCISDPLSMVLTEEDFRDFENDKKYLSAKLLTYFAEHPLLFIGYSAEDQNIKSILYDVDRMIQPNMALAPNIYFLDWDPDLKAQTYPPRDRVIAAQDGRNIRIKNITASSFEWVFKAFENNGTLEKINMKLLRALMARTMHLIRTDIPKKTVEVDFQTLEHAVENEENFAKLFGVTSISDPTQVNAVYPFTLTGVAQKLGYTNWSYANQLITVITEETTIDIKKSDNPYHITMKTGEKSSTNKYSQATVDLLAKVASGKDYVDSFTSVMQKHK